MWRRTARAHAVSRWPSSTSSEMEGLKNLRMGRTILGMKDAVAVAANLLAEPARAAMLLELMSGRALPAGELAEAANVSPQTASGHLARLVEGSFLQVEQQGRHRYYRLANTAVADAVEALLVLTNGVG